MIQTKFVLGLTAKDLEEKLNIELRSIEGNPTIKYYESQYIAVIEVEVEAAHDKRVCCECAFWDDVGHGSLANYCTMTGKKTRYNCKACIKFKDIRE